MKEQSKEWVDVKSCQEAWSKTTKVRDGMH